MRSLKNMSSSTVCNLIHSHLGLGGKGDLIKCSLMSIILIAYEHFLSAEQSAFSHFELYLTFFSRYQY